MLLKQVYRGDGQKLRLQENKMSLNIKNPETTDLIRKLAALKGVSMTYAVQVAVQKEIERDKAEQQGRKSKEGLAAWLMNISRETAPMMNDGRTTKELFDELYDERTGLPK
jgi:hypothetical protein